MIEISKKKILEFLGFNMKKIGILISILSGLIFSFSVYAADNNFLISSRCKDEYNSSCNIIRTVNDKSEIIIKDVKLLNILKINKNLYKVKTSCGSPCLVTIFYSKNKEDSTDEFIAIDNENNCLIESDSEKKIIYARKLFSNKYKIIVDLKGKEFKYLTPRFDYYTYFKHDSNFDNNGVLNLIATDYSNSKISKKIENPCGKDK